MFFHRKSLSWVYVLVWSLWLIPAVVGLSHVQAQEPNRVGLVIHAGKDTVITRCVELDEAAVSGYDVLMRSGLEIVVSPSSGMGVAICRIEDTGCQPPNCFCQCSGNICTYWSYWHLVGGQWSYSGVGSNAHQVRPGDVEGWSWSNGQPPPVISFEDVCALAATATSLPTSTPIPPTATLLPTHTATPLPTVVPTLTRDRSTDTPLPPPAEVPMDTVTVFSPTDTPSPMPRPSQMPTLFSGAASVTPTVSPVNEPSVTPKGEWQTPAPRQARSGGLSNYAVFGAFLAVLLVLAVIVLIRRKV